MKLGKSKNITVIVGSFLLATVIALLVMLASIEPTIAQASTAGTRMSSGIDYSGQGTVINNDLSGKPATVEGNYVRIPTWSYGAYTYNTWDEFWVGWSSWSTDNNKYFAHKGYNYNNQFYIKDAEKKTEYKWYREWNRKRDVYSTKYYREYKGKHIFHWGHKDSSWNGYPSNKGCCPSTIYTKSEKRGTQSYVEREESGYAFSAPFRWAWDPQWKTFAPRDTYRVKKVDLTWDASWKKDSSELVPLNYSLYKQDGSSISGGLKWTYIPKLTTQKNRGFFEMLAADGMPNEKNLSVVQYYVTSKEVIAAIRDNLEVAYKERYGQGAISFATDKLVDKLIELSLPFFAKSILQKGLAGLTVVMLEYINYSAFTGDQIALFEYSAKLNSAASSPTNSVVIMSFVHNVSAVVVPSRKLRLGFDSIDKVSMQYNYDFNYKHGLEYYIPNGAKAFGEVQYQDSKTMKDEISNVLNDELHSWFTYFPWNLTK